MFTSLMALGVVLFGTQNYTLSPANDSLFSISAEQMVFASKLSESYRKIYCYKFSMVERQEALDEWKEAMRQGDAPDFSPDEAVKMIAQESCSLIDQEDR